MAPLLAAAAAAVPGADFDQATVQMESWTGGRPDGTAGLSELECEAMGSLKPTAAEGCVAACVGARGGDSRRRTGA